MMTARSLGPSRMDETNVLKWCRHALEFKGSVQKKALTLVAHNCIRYIGMEPEYGSRHCFVSLPLDTYDYCLVDGRKIDKIPFDHDFNHSREAYKIFKDGAGNFSCTCQGWRTKEKRGELVPKGANCAHVLALFLAFKLKKFGRHQGNDETHEAPDMMQEEVILA